MTCETCQVFSNLLQSDVIKESRVQFGTVDDLQRRAASCLTCRQILDLLAHSDVSDQHKKPNCKIRANVNGLCQTLEVTEPYKTFYWEFCQLCRNDLSNWQKYDAALITSAAMEPCILT